MALRDLSQGDFEFYRRYNSKMINTHEKEFLQQVDPELMRAFYRGYRRTQNEVKLFMEKARSKTDMLVTLTKIFTATNTVLPNLYFQNPRKLAIPTRNSDPDSAALMTAILNHYMKETKQKEENQEAIMNAWFFGLGWKKIGYRIATESQLKGPEQKLSFMDKASLGIQSILGIEPSPIMHKEYPDVVRYEQLTSTSESPCDVRIDHKGNLKNYRIISQGFKRSLWDLMEFGRYEKGVINDIKEKLEVDRGSRFDMRDIEVHLEEMMIEQRNGVWLLAYIREFNDSPLRYEKMAHDGVIPWEPLCLTNEPSVRYPTSHLNVASKAQEWIDNVSNLQVEVLGKMRNQHYVNENILSFGQKEAFRRNMIGGVIFGKQTSAPGDIANISSSGVSNDMFNMLALFQSNLTEILGADAQRISGASTNKTLGQDQLAAVGTQIRESGMLDRIRQWIVNSTYKEGQFIKQFSNSTLHLKITNQDFADVQNRKNFEEQWVEFMTLKNPLPARRFLEGSFDYDVNIYEAVKPNNPLLRQQYIEAIKIFSDESVMNAMLQNGKRIKLDSIVERIGKTFEYINSDEFIENLDSRQQAAIQAMQVLQQNKGVVPQQLGGEQQQVEAQREPQGVPGG